MEIFIYKLIDPISNEIRYVGKTKNTLTKRLYEHLTVRNLKPNNHKNNWIKLLLSLNVKPKIELIEIVNANNWIQKEIYWINYFRENGYNLTNTSNGGEGSFGYKMSQESIKKSLETRQKNNTLTRSEDCKKAISQSKLGTTHSKEQTEHVANFLRKTILQYDLEQNIIKEWFGIRKCAKELNLNHNMIIKYLDSNIPYKGFIWKRYSQV
jgi:group I intron endonuclease